MSQLAQWIQLTAQCGLVPACWLHGGSYGGTDGVVLDMHMRVFWPMLLAVVASKRM
jgi:hypothetical protein